MTEKRRSTRHPIYLHLSICDLYKQDMIGIHDLDSPIHLENISRGGLCFRSECVLPTDYYFNASLNTTDSADPVLTVVKIIRSEIIDRDEYRYGCEFTEMTEPLVSLLDQYTTACQITGTNLNALTIFYSQGIFYGYFLSFAGISYPSYFLINKDFPVISSGCFIPINSIKVGMISAKHPFSLKV